jgi:hypothetical protein
MGTALGPLPGSGKLGGNDLFAKNFKLPQVFKASFAVDQKLAGFVVSGRLFITIIYLRLLMKT